MSESDSNSPIPWWQVVIVGRNPRTTLVRLVVTAVLVYFGFRASVQPIVVSGISMAPTHRDGRRLFVNRLAYRFSPPRRGDVIAIREAGEKLFLLKRVIALPGERIRIVNGQVLIDDQVLDEPYLLPPAAGVRNPSPWNVDEVHLRADELYVIGDNRSMRKEDHYFGRVDFPRVVGRLFNP
jgi:signal peptidase I